MIRNPRWEQALIGTSLAFPTEVYSVTDVRPQDMGYVSHQTLWTIILEQERGNRLSYQAVLEKLHAQDKLNDLGADVEDGDLTGELYLQELLARHPFQLIPEPAGFGRKRPRRLSRHPTGRRDNADARPARSSSRH